MWKTHLLPPPLSSSDDIEEQMQCITLDDTSLLSIPQEDSIEELISSPSSSTSSSVTDFKQIALQNVEAEAETPAKTIISSTEANGEPIYAVIDLREKYQRRAQLNKQVLPAIPINEQTSANSVFRVVDGDANLGRGGQPFESSVRRNSGGGCGDKYSSSSCSTTSSSCDNNNNNNNKSNLDTVDGEYPKLSSRSSQQHQQKQQQQQQRPKSFQLLYSNNSGDYEEVKLENHLFMRDYLFLSRNEWLISLCREYPPY